MSSRELAKRYNVDAATVVRAIQDLGYERFADFAADLREHFVRQITPYTVLKASTRKRRSVADHVDGGLERDTENLRVLKSSLQMERVVELATLMHRSRRILVVGVDLAASLAWFLAYGLTPLGFAAEAPVGSAGNLQHKIDVLDQRRSGDRASASGAASGKRWSRCSGRANAEFRGSASPTATPRRSRCIAMAI